MPIDLCETVASKIRTHCQLTFEANKKFTIFINREHKLSIHY
ncbi:hypothetical protein VCRA2121O68_450002 [Vibrio crassostreae]|uniref:Uncharacterized protein n=1 Tax=Vibrio coralliirubri TaxID=1516159 RepID=A0A0T7ED71_9VIBR|nr:hypothetical protein VCRA2117O328_160002 [Vibrio crassostreae]CDT35279.1 hypothetical protein VCR4J2_40159 [Vibrio coralliirubri]CAK1890274.1 hypothetical protein VCRA2110O4_220002 [Vibrio crassostreae]CAK1907940.1 hypothetical protein VCRA2114E5_210105 [Vibrio crassostreae]CAK1942597.1 hypothetical protein VCRA2118O236_290002 [Vibrio crassostreae]